jgi:hypothetical protein
MKKLIMIIAVMLSACASTQVATVKQPWPEVPDELKQPCIGLKLVDNDTTKLSEVLIVVTDNYAQYKECRDKVDGWLDWYSTQKKIYESVK